MRIAIFGKQFDPPFNEAIGALFTKLLEREYELFFHSGFVSFLKERSLLPEGDLHTFDAYDPAPELDLLISIGGDGTLLDTLQIVKDSGVLVLGVNTGRLGFLSNVSTDEIDVALDAIHSGKYQIDERSLIEVEAGELFKGAFPYALNEVTIHKKDDASMVSVKVHMGDRYVNTYWADGLIVSTPTGSTAYSLSCGGPIVMPGSANFILTPIAPHNLNVRPLVVPNDCELRLSVEGRASDYLLTIDSYSFPLPAGKEVTLRTAPFTMRLLNLEHQHFFQTIRNKMHWGIDKRN